MIFSLLLPINESELEMGLDIFENSLKEASVSK